MIKVGLVGIGGMGMVHFNAYRRLKNARVVAVADIRCDMAREKAKDTDARIYSSLDELLANEECDMIDICSPSYLHTEMAIKALRAGCNVLCEKPMSISTADTGKVIEAAKKHGKLFMTAHVVRFMQPYRYLRSVIEKGELGKLVHLDMKRLSGIPLWSWDDWMRDVKRSGGTPFDLSIHDIDFAYSVFGEPAFVNGIYKELRDDDSDYIVSNLVYDGFTVTARGGWYLSSLGFDAGFLAIFEKGTVELSCGKLFSCGKPVELPAAECDDEDTEINLPRAEGYTDEIKYFIDCIEKGEYPLFVTPESSEGSVCLVERILENSIKL